jgi:hypothetical protein
MSASLVWSWVYGAALLTGVMLPAHQDAMVVMRAREG